MELMHRTGRASTDYLQNYLQLVKNNPGCCDNVWIGTPYGFPTLKTHEENAQNYKKLAEEFRAAGVSVSLQVSNTLGHGESALGTDISGLIYEGTPAEFMVGANGEQSGSCFCFRGKFVRDYMVEEIRLYAEAVKPDCIWIDDDFNAGNHESARFACFCDSCMKKFNTQYDSRFTREELVEEILHGDPVWRRRQREFTRKGLYDLMYDIGSAVHAVSENTRLCYQFGAYGAYIGYDFNCVLDAMRDSTGLSPMVRPGNGIYCNYNVNFVPVQASITGWMISKLPSYVKRIVPEVDNLPFQSFTASIPETKLQITTLFAGGGTDMSLSVAMNFTEPLSWYNKMFAMLAESRRYWDRLAAINADSIQSGARLFVSTSIGDKTLTSSQTLYDLDREYVYTLDSWNRLALPIAYRATPGGLTLLLPEAAEVISDEEFRTLLGKRVILDGAAVEILNARGFFTGIQSRKVPAKDINLIKSVYEAHPVNPRGEAGWYASFYAFLGSDNCYYLENDGADWEVISRYALSGPNQPSGLSPLGKVAEAVINTAEGGKWAVMAYLPRIANITLAKREQILNMWDYIGERPLAARLCDPLPAYIYPREDADGRTVAVTVINATVGTSDALHLRVRNPKSENFYYVSESRADELLPFTKEKGEYLLTLPPLGGWEAGTVYIQ